MKAFTGFMLAIAIGVVGAACNWYYIHRKAQDYEKVSFAAIRHDRALNVGDRFQQGDFEKIDIPKARMGNLDKVAVKWDQIHTVLGYKATRTFHSGEILLQQDLKTPSPRGFADMLGPDEDAKSVPVDARTFIPARVNPGDMVSFTLPQLRSTSSDSSRLKTNVIPMQTFGKFEILALGTRTGQSGVQSSSGRSGGSEYLITIRVPLKGPMKQVADDLFEHLRMAGNKGAEVTIHSAAQIKHP